jgi:DNA transformation protein
MSEFVENALDLMSALDSVRARRMFGGHGIFRGERMFALVIDAALYFKAYPASRHEFTGRGLRPFTYSARGRTVSLQYYEAPPGVWDDPAAMQQWTSLALEAAMRTATKKKTSKAGSGKRKPEW